MACAIPITLRSLRTRAIRPDVHMCLSDTCSNACRGAPINTKKANCRKTRQRLRARRCERGSGSSHASRACATRPAFAAAHIGREQRAATASSRCHHAREQQAVSSRATAEAARSRLGTAAGLAGGAAAPASSRCDRGRARPTTRIAASRRKSISGDATWPWRTKGCDNSGGTREVDD